MERGGQTSGELHNAINYICMTCPIVLLIVLAILFLLTLAFSILSLIVFLFNGDAAGNWNTLTTFPEYEYEAVEDTANRDY